MRKILALCMLGITGIFIPFFVSAEDTPTQEQAILLATVNIKDARIVSQDENTLHISFAITNREIIQTGVKYGIKIIKETPQGQFLADEKVYEEVLTLAEHSENPKEISYMAPAGLAGEYTILLVVNNENGFPLGISQFGKVSFTAATSGVALEPDSCFLEVVGEKSSPHYNLVQGVDISTEETLKLTCAATNLSKSPLSAAPSFETRFRSAFGETVDHIGGSSSPISFGALEKKTISLILPKAKDPQAYNVQVALKTGDILSNTVTAQYVIRGASATVQQVSLDRDYYGVGESARISFIWSPSADTFPGSRGGIATSSPLSFEARIVDGTGAPCVEPVTGTLSGTIKEEIPVSITEACKDPRVTVSIKDDIRVFDQETLSRTTAPVQVLPWDRATLRIVIVAIAAIFISAGTFVFIKRRKGKGGNDLSGTTPLTTFLFLCMFAAAGSMVPTKEARADTFSYSANYGNSVSVVVNFDKGTNVFYPNESIKVTSSVQFIACGNTSGTTVLSGTGPVGGSVSLINSLTWGGTVLYGSGTFTAPSSPGNYAISFTSTLSLGYSGSYSMPFSVITPPVGTIVISPSIQNAPWTLQYRFCWWTCRWYNSGKTGTGSSVITMSPGYYKVLWNNIVGSDYLASFTGASSLVNGGSVTFNARYIPMTGTVVISPNIPDATWTLSGCKSQYGGGGGSINYVPVGNCTVTWNNVSGYYAPVPAQQTLYLGGISVCFWFGTCVWAGYTTTFSSSYTRIPVNGSCGSTNNSCTAGTLSDTADSATYYYWSCNGLYNGAPASCSLAKPNSSPALPAISGPASGEPNTPYSFTISSTDTENQIHYGIDWNMDGTADIWLPALPGYVNSGVSQSTSYTWSTAGAKTFQARAQDVPGLNSGWKNFTITLAYPPCDNSTNNPPTCSQCPAGQAFFAGYCTSCSNGGCTGGGGSTSDPDGSLVCNNGTANPPLCNLCSDPYFYNGSACVSCGNGGCTSGACTNGATNPPTCSQCPSGQELAGGACIVSCGNGACTGTETLLTCPQDCSIKYQQI